MQYTHKYSSPLGAITTASDGQNLTGLWFDGQKYFGRTLEKEPEEKFLSVFECTDAWLDMYFREKTRFYAAPLSSGSPFRQKVWEILLAIPYGKTTTYGAIAAQIAAETGLSHMSAQAVGGAWGHNPISVIVPLPPRARQRRKPDGIRRRDR